MRDMTLSQFREAEFATKRNFQHKLDQVIGPSVVRETVIFINLILIGRIYGYRVVSFIIMIAFPENACSFRSLFVPFAIIYVHIFI